MVPAHLKFADPAVIASYNSRIKHKKYAAIKPSNLGELQGIRISTKSNKNIDSKS